MQNRRLTLFILTLAVAGGGAYARAKVVEDTSGTLKGLTNIADALDSADRHPVHMLYVHGIDEVGAGDSKMLRNSICTELRLCAVSDWKNARHGVCRQRRIFKRSCSLQRLPIWEIRCGTTPKSGMRRRHSSCTGSCTSGDIPPFWWWMKSTGGRLFWRSNAAA